MVEVHCVCGRRYPVPDDKAGKKLQCKRCGAINRIPKPTVGDQDDVLIPFRDPGEDDGDDGDDDLGLAPPEPPPLEIRDPLRRCPSCGHQDEASVVLCVRCGYDFRTGRRMQDAHEAGERSARVRAANTAGDELSSLSSMAWIALTPLGLGLGPYLLARSFVVERQAGGLSPRDDQALHRVRVLAVGGLILWIVALGALGVLIQRRGREAEEAVDRECRERLQRVGAALRVKVESERRFPPVGGDWSKALAELSGQGSADLSCPVGGDLYPFRKRDTEVLTPQAEPGYLILWEREPHLDAKGKLVFRALRFDGRVEAFAQRSDLDAATRRAAFALEQPPATTTTTTGQGSGSKPPKPGPGPEPRPPTTGDRDALRMAIENFLAYAGTVDDGDPDFSGTNPVDPEFFTERVGIPPQELLPKLIKGPDPDARVQAARMLARMAMPRDFCLTHARTAAKDEAAEVRLGAAVCLHRHGDDGWLPAMASVAEDAEGEETRRVALDWIGREASKGIPETRRILAHAGQLRGQTRTQGADAIIALPPSALPHVVALLTDSGVAREAAATLYTAGEAGLEVLVPILTSERPKDARQAAFGVIDMLRVGGVIKLEDHLKLIDQELDPAVRAVAAAGMAATRGPPAAPLLDWALESLRRGAPGPLGSLCEGLINRAGHGPDGAAALERLVVDLSRDGDHAAVIRTLRLSPWRLLDERIDTLLAARWERVGDAATRIELARLLSERQHEASQRALLLAAADDVEDVRIEALKGLKDGLAVRGPDLQREAARVVAQRLRDEESPRALPLLIGLASNGVYCEMSGEGQREHKCPTALPRALEQLARKGDRAAIRALRGHPTEKVLEFLLSALDGAREDSIKQEIVGALVALTAVGLTTFDTAEWRKYIAPPTPKVLTRLGDQARDEALRLQTVQGRATSRLNLLRSQAANRPPP